MTSKSKQEFNRRWNGRSGWNRQYLITDINKYTPAQIEHYMWVAFQAGVKFGKKGGNNGNE